MDKLKEFIVLLDHKVELIFNSDMDKEYSLVLELLEEYIFKYIELAHLLKKPVKESLVMQFKESIQIFNKLESLSVKSNFKLRRNENENSNANITYSSALINHYNSIVFDQETNKACDNCRCIVF